MITAIFDHLKDKREPVPLKVAAVELIKAMQADEDEATAEAVKAAVNRYPEVRTRFHTLSHVAAHCTACLPRETGKAVG